METMNAVSKTRRAVLAFVAALGLLPLAACIDDFPVPLDPGPKEKLDQGLIGTWSCMAVEPKVPSDLVIKPEDEDARLVLKFEDSSPWYSIRTVGLDKGEDQNWDAYPSKLGGLTVLNAWPRVEGPKAPRKEVTLLSYAWLSPTLFQFNLIDPDPLKGSALSPASALRKTLQARRSDRAVFTPWIVCARAKIVDPS